MLRNSGRTPMPSGNMRISSSSPPGRKVGLMQPSTPRQLVNAMMISPVSELLRRVFEDGLDAVDDRRRRFVELLDQCLNLRAAGEIEIDLTFFRVGAKF